MKRWLLIGIMGLFGFYYLFAEDTAKTPYPEITITDGLIQDFGSQYVGIPCNPQTIQIVNTGTALLVIHNIMILEDPSAYTVAAPSKPISIPAGGSRQFTVTFTPLLLGTNVDYMYIQSNDPITPFVELTLTGVGLFAPPSAVQNLQISLQQQDIQLSWDPVTTNIVGQALTPDRYLVLYSQDTTGNHYWTLAVTPQLLWTHSGAVTYAPSRFYQVKAVMFNRPEDALLLQSLEASGRSLTNSEVEMLFGVEIQSE
ncbi:MAG: choice-of-anchor D domain-containing protein [Candidatus Cloacimonetes bacterium]|nr:choice-of-anchor D domain-containing protein [Candidatus Cloacimonadota bacterium]